MLKDSIYNVTLEKFIGENKEDWDMQGVADFMHEKYGIEIEDMEEYKGYTVEEYAEKLYEKALSKYQEKEQEIGPDLMRRLEKYILFEVVDSRWREHLKGLDALREGIYLRSYGQKDPVIEYKLISGEMYGRMLNIIKEETTSYAFKVVIRNEEEPEHSEEVIENESYSTNENYCDDGMCSCGSGKLYAKCCGRI
jgi:preprotein translocase subunit SecA